MKFFKYFIFIIISLFSVHVFAATTYAVIYGNTVLTGYSSGSAACSAMDSRVGITTYYDTSPAAACYNNGTGKKVNWYNIRIDNNCLPDEVLVNGVCTKPVTCPNSGYPVPVYFDANTPIPLRVCKANPDGTYCIYDAANKANPLVISLSEKQQVVLQSISSIPSPSCTPEFSKSTCDPKDPYGGCYKPPDDGCNRMADGSIYCPEGTPPPPIQTGCSNNATYCDMPPTGCGSNYVPGNFNGKQICVKNSNPPPTDPIDQPPDPTDPPPPDPNDPPPASTPPPAIPPDNNGPILRSILDAINAVNNKLTWVKDEIVNSVNNVANKLGITNQKLDTVNLSIKETTAAVNANGDKIKSAVDANATTVKTAVEANTAATNSVKGAVDANTNSTANKLNEVVNAINNKPVGGGGTAVSMEPVVNAIEKQTTDFKDMMKTDSSDFDTSQYEKIGDPSDDPRYLNAQSDATNALQQLSNKLTFSSTACVQDFTVDFPYFGSFVVPISRWCEILALIKILIHLSTIMLAFRMLDSTVRAI